MWKCAQFFCNDDEKRDNNRLTVEIWWWEYADEEHRRSLGSPAGESQMSNRQMPSIGANIWGGNVVAYTQHVTKAVCHIIETSHRSYLLDFPFTVHTINFHEIRMRTTEEKHTFNFVLFWLCMQHNCHCFTKKKNNAIFEWVAGLFDSILLTKSYLIALWFIWMP